MGRYLSRLPCVSTRLLAPFAVLAGSKPDLFVVFVHYQATFFTETRLSKSSNLITSSFGISL
jgi:hypothetical protein